MGKTRIFLLTKPEDAEHINIFLSELERKDEEYDIEYHCDEGYPGVVVTVEWEID